MMMLEKKATEFIEVLSSAEPVPGGGGASATVGALASALGMMVTNLTIGKKRYADVEDEMREVRDKLSVLRDELIILTDKDAEAFAPLAAAYKLPKDTPEEKPHKEEVLEEALYEASIVPFQIMETIYQVMKYLEVLAKKGTRMAVSDVGVAVLFARSSLEGASLNIYINTKSMKNRETAESLNEKTDWLIEEARKLEEKIYLDVLAQIR